MDRKESTLDAKQLILKGIVQGVGFRPYVARVAEQYHIYGTVKNIGGAVRVAAVGKPHPLRLFLHTITNPEIPHAYVESIEEEECSVASIHGLVQGFRIIPSDESSRRDMFLLPDIGICKDCLGEVFDPKDRRYRYPFNSCVSCGPRFSILKKQPYDRENITMDEFPMCESCKEEYTASGNRRRHAQTIGCPDCGPQLYFKSIGQAEDNRIRVFNRDDSIRKSLGSGVIHDDAPNISPLIGDAALRRAAEILKQGNVIIMKGIGGYHLACRADDSACVSAIRRMKGREEKPLAVLFPNMEAVERHCFLSHKERELLDGDIKPIVLLTEKKEEASHIASEVRGESTRLGCMLPYTAQHALITSEVGPIVLTSANKSGMPLIYSDSEIWKFAGDVREPLLKGILWHDRQILRQMDDSVVQVIDERQQLIRFGRGLAPGSIAVPNGKTYARNRKILAMGGDLKAAFTLMRGNHAVVSQYFGDLEHVEVQERYAEELIRDKKILHLSHSKVVCDMHPGYYSTRMAEELKMKDSCLMEVQHHEAHIASVACEHGITSPCIGIAFDGTGYGTDGAIWGGECFLWNGDGSLRRMGHLAYEKLVGGDNAAKDALSTLCCMLNNHGLSEEADRLSPKNKILRAAQTHNINCMQSSSMGRLFDAVSALLGICTTNSYEGRCAILLEQAARRAFDEKRYGVCMQFELKEEGGMLLASARGIFKSIIEAKQANVSDDLIALGFHEAVAILIRDLCLFVHRSNADLDKKVLLSGGVFQNRILYHLTYQYLEASGYQVYTNEKLPVGDGGISLGQAYIAGLTVEE